MAALLTIWRWGRIATDIEAGLPLGSFEQWCRWVRDPLLALGCQDPVERVSEAKERDGRRQAVAELFAIWWEKHRDQPIAVRQLHDDVKQAADPQGRGRQYLASQLEKLAGTRMAGFVLTRQAPAGKWGAATYALQKTGARRTIGTIGGIGSPMPPMVPMSTTRRRAAAPRRPQFRYPPWPLWLLPLPCKQPFDGRGGCERRRSPQAACAAGVKVAVDGEDLILEAAAPPSPVVLELSSRDKPRIVALLSPCRMAGPPATGRVSSPSG